MPLETSARWYLSFSTEKRPISGQIIPHPFLPQSFVSFAFLLRFILARISPGLKAKSTISQPRHNASIIRYRPSSLVSWSEVRIYYFPWNQPEVILGMRKYVYIFTPEHFFEFIIQVTRSVYEIMFEWSLLKMIWTESFFKPRVWSWYSQVNFLKQNGFRVSL